jgi:hypothetical protein
VRRGLVTVAAFLVVAASACGGSEPLTTGLHVAVTNVGWKQEDENQWRMVGARVDVDCELGKMAVSADHVDRSAEPSVSTVCSAIQRDPDLLPAPGPAGLALRRRTWDG